LLLRAVLTMNLLRSASVIVVTILAVSAATAPDTAAQGTIYGTVRDSHDSIPSGAGLTFFGFIRDVDVELRVVGSVGAGYDSGNWYDDFQNYLSEAAGEPFDYYFFDTSSGEGFHLAATIPANSFQEENIALSPGSWPEPVQPIAVPVIDSGIRVSWDTLAGLTAHIYRRFSVADGSFFRIDDTTGSLDNRGVSGGSYIDTSVDRASLYDYLIVFEDDAGGYSPPIIIVEVNSACVAGSSADADGDAVADTCDNCPNTYNPDQADSDGDGSGDACQHCCNTDGIRGDADNDCTFGCVTVADISYLTTHLFMDGPPPVCEDEGNADGDCTFGCVTVADISYLVTHLFLDGPAPPACP
jgi:hypothetical protein